MAGDARTGLNHSDFAAETAKNLPHFETDVSTTDDDKMARKLAKLEQADVVQMRHVIDARKRRNERAGAYSGERERSFRDGER